MAKEEAKQQAVAVKAEPVLVEQVLTKVNNLREIGGITLPADYSAENALRYAWLSLQDLTDSKTNTLILPAVTRESVANSLFSMVSQGLSPQKRQCSFIKYGNKLTLQREYGGSIALAKRYAKVKDIFAQVIYEKDIFEFEVDTTTGMKHITKHESRLENMDESKIRGGYAVVIYEDGRTNLEVMTIDQVRKSWAQGQSKGDSPAHRNFAGEMVKKTVINRACKVLISSSDDSVLYESESDNRLIRAKAEVQAEANNGQILSIPEESIQVAEVVCDNPISEGTSPKPSF
jgi:recombination protein RecT